MGKRSFFKIFLTLLISMLFISSGICKEPDTLEEPPKQPSLRKFRDGLGGDFQKKFINENGKPNDAYVAEATWNSAGEGFGLQGMSLSTLQFMQVPNLSNINTVLTELGLAAAVVQLGIDVYKGDSYIGTLKFLKSYALYKMGKSSVKLLSAAALSISFIDYSLTKFGTVAIKMRRTKWEQTFYNYFDNTGMGGKLNYDGWKKLLRNAKTPEDVETIVCNYLNTFWTEVDDDTRNHFLPNDASKVLAEPTPKEQKEITYDYYKYVLAPEIRTCLHRMAKEDAKDQYNAEMLKLRQLLNETYRLQITIKGPDELLKKRLPFKLGPWIRRTNTKGLEVFEFNLYSYLKAKTPDKVTIALSKKDRIKVKLPKPTWDNYFIVKISILTKIDTRVLDKETNEPIPGAELVIKGMSFYDKNLIPEIKSIMPKNLNDLGKISKEKYFCQRIVSDKYGQLLLDNIPAGIYTIVLSAKGYNPLKMEKVKFYNPRTKPLYLDPGMELGINIKAKQMSLKWTNRNAPKPKPYMGPINIMIDVANYRAKVNFDVGMKYYHWGAIGGARINKKGNITYGGGASNSYPCKAFMKADGWYNMKRLYKLSDGKYEFKTALIKYSPRILEYKYKDQDPVVKIPSTAESLLKNSFSGIIDLRKKTVKGRFGRGEYGGLEFEGTVELVSSNKKKTQKELFVEIDRLLKDKKQAKKMTKKERKEMNKEIGVAIRGILGKSN